VIATQICFSKPAVHLIWRPLGGLDSLDTVSEASRAASRPREVAALFLRVGSPHAFPQRTKHVTVRGSTCALMLHNPQNSTNRTQAGATCSHPVHEWKRDCNGNLSCNSGSAE
jgi:hypothetical protein